MAWVQDKKFFGIKKGLAGLDKRPTKEAGSCFDRTVYAATAVEPPGRHSRVNAIPNPSAFSFGVSVKADVKPSNFLHRHTGFGGSSTMKAAATVPKYDRLARIGKPPASGYAAPRNNPPNSDLRRAYERGDLPCIISQAGNKKALDWKVAGGDLRVLDYKHYLPLFFDGLREEEAPLYFYASQGIADLLKFAPEKVAAVVPHIVVPIRQALNTRRREVMVRAVEALRLVAICDANAPGGPRAATALIPYFRQLLPIINIFATRYRNPRGIDDEVRNRKNLEDRIQELLRALETYGGPETYINIKYMVPSYTSCKQI